MTEIAAGMAAENRQSKEACIMEIVIFFAFIAICAFALVWASRKTRSETDLAARKRAERNASRAEKLAAPGDALLSHGD